MTRPHPLDEKDPLSSFRNEFLFPRAPDGSDAVYLAGNSLGLQPRRAREYILKELEDWEKFGVEGHLHARHPWLPYHELLTGPMANVVGAKPLEVVVMNSLSVNLHLLMVSFYRPTKRRFKILVEANAFPSDQYAVASQAAFHGYDPTKAIVEAQHDDLLRTIEKTGHELALVLIGNVNYLTGQAFDIASITRACRDAGCMVGFDLAHGAGNLSLRLHDWGPDFAVWCNYKYLNAGPGAVAGCFVHERHAEAFQLPRFAGWWGHNKKTRFKMPRDFEPLAGAEGWQLSNPPVFQLAALRASLEIFEKAKMSRVRAKSEALTGYLESCLNALPGGFCEIITPKEPSRRGAQLSIRFKKDPIALVGALKNRGVICDFREPDIIRAAPAPLYTRFEDVDRFVSVLRDYAS